MEGLKRGEHIVVDIGATEIRVGMARSPTPVLTAATPRSDSDTLLTAVANMVQTVRAQYDDGLTGAIGVGCPGVIHDGVVKQALYLPLTGVDVGRRLERHIGVAVVVANDVDAQALGAAATPGTRLFVIAVGSAVGGAYVADGDVQRGRTASISEIGHLPVGAASDGCVCGGIGCLDTAAGGRVLDARLGQDWWMHPRPEVTEALSKAGVALSRAVRAVGVLYDVDHVLMLGKLLGFRDVWDGFYREYTGLGSNVPLAVSRETWSYAARGLDRVARRHTLEGPAAAG